jgi:hypothetical protein
MRTSKAARRASRRNVASCITAERASKARMSGPGDVRVRGGAIGEKRKEVRQHDVTETGMRNTMVLAAFAETKVARSR